MFLRFVTIIAFVSFAVQSQAANYYFSSSGSDSYTSAQAQNKATPWQSITKLNSYFASIKAGDSILFKCGDTFAGNILITKSGTAASRIGISSYGTGAKPIITGFATPGAWTSVGGGVFEAPCPAASLIVNEVALNGVAQPIGRYPNLNAANSGYLNVDSHVANTQITSSALSTGTNWAGAEVVIRKNHWILDRAIVVANTATAVTYLSTSTYQPLNNFGFFIQNHPNTLDQLGEWYFNPITRKIRMYFGGSVPAGSVVNVAGFDNLIYGKNVNYITINGLTLKGANVYAINIINTTGIIVQNCDISNSGVNGITGVNVNNLTIQKNTITWSNNDAINLSGNHASINNNVVKNNGTIAGMGQIIGNDYSSIVTTGIGNVVNNNDVENAGYDGIVLNGDSAIVKNNYVNTFTMVKDDGGGIYAWGATDTTKYNYGRQVVGNIVLNAVRATAGTSGTFLGSSDGIYMDENSSGVIISGNTVSACPGGIKLHNAQSITLTGNTLFNNDAQFISAHDQTNETTKNNVFKTNIVFSKYSTQPTLTISSINGNEGRFGTIDNNNYSNIINNVFPFNITSTAYNLSMWQAGYSKDLASTLAIPIPYYTFTKTAKRNKFSNGTFNLNITGVLSYSNNGNFKSSWENKLDGGSLKAYYSFISGAANNGQSLQIPVGALTAGSQYLLKFSMIGTKANRKITAYLINTKAPYNLLSEKLTTTIAVSRTENEFVFNPTASTATATLIFAFQDEDMTVWMDNIGLYPTTATLTNPDDYILFAYNNTTANQSLKLSGSYVDVKNKTYKGTTTLAPFTSIILLKNADTVSTLPPVVYDAGIDTTKTLSTFNSASKTASISVYPNPATDYINLSFADPGLKDLNIKIMNTNGDTIFNQKVQVTDNNYQLNFNTKPSPGCYFIQISGSGINQTSKVIII